MAAATSQRTYQKSHPWLTFSADLSGASPDLWVALGEARSKCEHLSWVPLLPSVWQQLHSVLLAKGALATTAIEGNTLSEEEVRKILDGSLKLPPSKGYLAQEINNTVDAVNDISKRILAGEVEGLSVDRIRDYNRRVFQGLSPDGEAVPGEIRHHEVSVARYPGAPARDCEYLLERMCSWLNHPSFSGVGDNAIVLGLLRAILAHLYIVWIHPFGDGNGRTARLVEFEILVSCGVPSAAAHLLSNHYNQTRTEYYRQLDAAGRSGGDVVPFIRYAVQGFVDGLREQLAHVREQHYLITWRDYVQELFRNRAGKITKVEARRQELALALAEMGRERSVTPAEVPELSTALARGYAGRTLRAIRRDLRILEGMELVKHGGARYSANWDCLSGFVPARRIPSQR